MKNHRKEVIIYTDGGCDPNPGPGGYGVVLVFGKHRKELSGGYRLTTNNRMELLAVVKGLEALKETCSVKIFSDSEYIVNAMTQGWVARWKARGWHRTKSKKPANHDIWQKLDSLCQEQQVEFNWVKGHANIPENERCDQLATQALNGNNLLVDEFYEQLAETAPKNSPEKSALSPQKHSSKSKVKITRENQPCRKCSTPVVKKTPTKKRKPGQTYYYEYYLYCPNCRTMYMLEEAKRFVEEPRLF
jgi:ribonuclease HI